MTAPLVSPFKIPDREFILLLATIQALVACAVDGMLPALGVMAAQLHAGDPNRQQLVVGVFLIGMGLGALFPGPLADRFGRRPVLFACLSIYVVPMVLCAIVRDFNTLVVLRLVQSLGCSGLTVVPLAIIRDRFEGDRMARSLSMVSMVFMIAPMAAPSAGQFILDGMGWRWIFGILAGLGTVVMLWAWARLPETLPSAARQTIRFGAIAKNMRMVVQTRASCGYVGACALLMSCTWGYINSSQQLIAGHFGAGRLFPLIFGVLALGMSLANFINSRIVVHFGARRVSHMALLMYLVAAAAQVVLAFSPGQTLWQFAGVMALTLGMSGFLVANFGSIALEPFGRAAGSAASVQYFLRTVLGSLLGALIGQSYDGTARPLAGALLVAGMASLLLVLFSERGNLFSRRVPDRPM